MNFPYEIIDISPEERKERAKDFPEWPFSFVRVGPDKTFLPNIYRKFSDKYYNFEVRADDVFILGCPRCGTTMVQEIVWFLFNNVDVEKGRKLIQEERINFFDIDFLEPQNMKPQNGFDNFHLDERKPRIFKSHLPLSLLPKNLIPSGCKIIYMARNPKDMVVSFWHFTSRLPLLKYTGTFERFVEYFMNNEINFNPFPKHVNEILEHQSNPNILFLFYEDLISDLRGNVETLGQHLGVNLNTSQLDLMENIMGLDNFKEYFKPGDILQKKNNADDGLVRKGKTGEWRKHFSEDLSKKFDDWLEENCKVKFPQT